MYKKFSFRTKCRPNFSTNDVNASILSNFLVWNAFLLGDSLRLGSWWTLLCRTSRLVYRWDFCREAELSLSNAMPMTVTIVQLIPEIQSFGMFGMIVMLFCCTPTIIQCICSLTERRFSLSSVHSSCTKSNFLTRETLISIFAPPPQTLQNGSLLPIVCRYVNNRTAVSIVVCWLRSECGEDRQNSPILASVNLFYKRLELSDSLAASNSLSLSGKGVGWHKSITRNFFLLFAYFARPSLCIPSSTSLAYHHPPLCLPKLKHLLQKPFFRLALWHETFSPISFHHFHTPSTQVFL